MENNDGAAVLPLRRPGLVSGFDDMLKAKGRVRRQLSKEELEKRREEQSAMAAVAIAYRTVVVLGFTVAMIYLNHDDPPLLVWSVGFLLCLLFYSWSHHINQFLLETYDVALSLSVLVVSLAMFFLSLMVAGLFSSKCAGMVMVCLDVILVAGYLVFCVANYKRTTPSSNRDKNEHQHAQREFTAETGDTTGASRLL
jgi:signal transduction histidine kinase